MARQKLGRRDKWRDTILLTSFPQHRKDVLAKPNDKGVSSLFALRKPQQPPSSNAPPVSAFAKTGAPPPEFRLLHPWSFFFHPWKGGAKNLIHPRSLGNLDLLFQRSPPWLYQTSLLANKEPVLSILSGATLETTSFSTLPAGSPLVLPSCTPCTFLRWFIGTASKWCLQRWSCCGQRTRISDAVLDCLSIDEVGCTVYGLC